MTKSCRLSLQSVEKGSDAVARRAQNPSPGSFADVGRKRGTLLSKETTSGSRSADSYLGDAQTSLNR